MREPLKRRLFSLPCFLLLALLPLAPLAAQEEPPAAGAETETGTFFETVDVEVINVEVYVTDKEGNPVTGLTKDDFELYVDGARQPITNFYAEVLGRPSTTAAGEVTTAETPAPAADAPPAEQQLHLAILVDNLHLKPGNRKQAFRYLREFLDENLGPDDVVTVASLNRSLFIHNDFTSDRRLIDKVLSQIEEMAATDFESDVTERRILQEVAEARSPRANTAFYESSILQQVRAYAENEFRNGKVSLAAMEGLVRTLAGVRGRKAILQVSGGISTRPGEGLYDAWRTTFDNDGESGVRASSYDSDVGSYDLLPDFRRLGAIANASRVTFYALDAVYNHRALAQSVELTGGEQGTISTTELDAMETNARAPLELTAHTTGGRRLQISSKLDDELAKLAGELSTFYSLGFTSAGYEPGEDHKIEVKVTGKGLRVRSRDSFRAKSRDERTGEATMAALLYNTGDNPLGVSLEPGQAQTRQDGNKVVPVLVKVPVKDLTLLPQPGGQSGAQLSFFVTVREKGGGARPVQKIPFHFNVPTDKLAEAQAQTAAYPLPLVVHPGDVQAVIGVRDDHGGVESTVRIDLDRYSDGKK